jgi:hypothetical protein
MNPNPYQPPAAAPARYEASFPGDRRMFMIAGAAAMLASLFWGVLALLRLGSGLAGGPLLAILPLVLVVLYAQRGFQLFKLDANAAQRITRLHGIGAIAALLQVMQVGDGVMQALYVFKLLVNVGGGVTAWLAYRSTRR